MSNVTTSVHVCETWEQRVESEAHLTAVYRGLSENTLRHCGPMNLGKAIRVFLRDAQGAVVGGIDGLVVRRVGLHQAPLGRRGATGPGTRDAAPGADGRRSRPPWVSERTPRYLQLRGAAVLREERLRGIRHARRLPARAPEALPTQAVGDGDPMSFRGPAASSRRSAVDVRSWRNPLGWRAPTRPLHPAELDRSSLSCRM